MLAPPRPCSIQQLVTLLARVALAGIVLLTGLAQPLHAREVRVGVYDNPPKLMLSEDGRLTGILGDLLQEIARREDWQLRLVRCEWDSCLATLEAGGLDLMPDLAHTAARAQRFDMHATPALHSWSQIYRREDVRFDSMLDMEGRRIAVLAGSVQQEHLTLLADSFGIPVEWLPVGSMDEAIAAVLEGRADAMAASHHFGDWAATRRGLLQTGVIFQPSKLYFATGKQRNADLLAAIDRHLVDWRRHSDSFYFEVLRRWGAPVPEPGLSRHLGWLLLAFGALLALSFVLATLLRIEVARRTRVLRASEERLATVLNSVDASIFIKGADLRYRYVNQRLCDLYGLPAERIIGQRDDAFLDAASAAREREDDERVVRAGKRLAREHTLQTRSGQSRSLFTVTLPLRDDQGRVTELCGIATDLTEQQKLLAELHELSFFDPLTRLPNRLQLQQRLDQALEDCGTQARQGALLLVNLDRFREVNDTRGHAAGDAWLQQVALRLKASLPSEAMSARVGPDEFAVLLPHLPLLASEAQRQTAALAQRLLDQLADPVELGGERHHGTASIGVTLFTSQAGNAEEVLKQADLALAEAKLTGRNRARFFAPEMGSAVTARAALETELRSALQAGQFLLHYQPQVDDSGRMFGAEALLRWQHPTRGLVPPASFIPLAEASGLILPLGSWVLRQACAQLSAWSQSPRTSDLRIAVNVSARQLHQPGFVESVIAELQSVGVPGNRLELEITESLLVEDIEAAIRTLGRLRAQGVRIALDDFGTGYSALHYIKRLPLDVLKIDNSFVRDLLIEPNDMAIVRTVIALGQSLGLDVVAEGVEDGAQREVLLELGCRQFQGYLFGRPVPVELLEQGLAASVPA